MGQGDSTKPRFYPKGYEPPGRHPTPPPAPRRETDFGEPICSRHMPVILPKEKLIVNEPAGPPSHRRRAETDWTILWEAFFWFVLMVIVGCATVLLAGSVGSAPEVQLSSTTRFLLNVLIVILHVVMLVIWCIISYFRALWEVRKRMFAITTVCYTILLGLYTCL
jgi:hypothetical protein